MRAAPDAASAAPWRRCRPAGRRPVWRRVGALPEHHRDDAGIHPHWSALPKPLDRSNSAPPGLC